MGTVCKYAWPRARVPAHSVVAQVSFSESLGEWLERDEARIFDMDDCRGFNCGCHHAKSGTNVS